MANYQDDEAEDQNPNAVPVVGLALGGVATAVLVFGTILFIMKKGDPDTPPGPQGLENPPVFNLEQDKQGDKKFNPISPKEEPWWNEVPTSNLTATVAQLKTALPQDQALLDSLGTRNLVARLEAYNQWLPKVPELVRNPKVESQVGRFLIDSYAFEPLERNATLLREWFVSQIPQEEGEFPPAYSAEDLDRSYWALNVIMDFVANKEMPKEIRFERVQFLCEDLGKAFTFAIDPKEVQGDLKGRAEKMLALRCYGKLGPTAAKSLAHALALRSALLKKAEQSLSLDYRQQKDMELVFGGVKSAKKEWPAYRAILEDFLKSEDQGVQLAVIELYAKVDTELADRIEPMLTSKWANVLKEDKLDQAGKAKAFKRKLGVLDPTDRIARLDKLARETVAGLWTKADPKVAPKIDPKADPKTDPKGEAKSEPKVDETHALLQDAARLAHASTVACALLQKDVGQARFDELIAKIPAIEQEKSTVMAKDDKGDKQPGKNKAVDPTAGLVIGPAGKVINDQLIPGAFFKVYPVGFRGGRTYAIHLASGAFDAFLHLQNTRGVTVRSNDDSGGGLNSLIVYFAPVDEIYRVVATSLGGRSLGPYTLSIHETNGFGPGMPFPGNPFFPGGPRFGFPPPGVMVPGQPIQINPEQPKKEEEKKKDDKDKKTTKEADGPPQIEASDLADLDKTNQKTRVTAFGKIAAALKGDLVKNDLPLAQAKKIGQYLATRTKLEADSIANQLPPLAKSRSFLLVMTDHLDQGDADQKGCETVVGGLIEQPLQFAKDEWRAGCRKTLLLQVLMLPGRQGSPATQASDLIRNFYKEQGILLGMEDGDFRGMNRPGQVMENTIKFLADKVGSPNLPKEDQGYLKQVPRHLAAARTLAQNDLEHTIMLQRVWIKVLGIYFRKHNPERAPEIRKVYEELHETDRHTTNVLEQLRAGEAKILRLWVLAHDLK